jgi:hypothetical protein
VQLRRVLTILQDAATASDPALEPKSLAQIRAAIEALPITAAGPDASVATPGLPGQPYSARIGQQLVKEAVLQDLDAHIKAQTRGARASAASWAAEVRPAYAAWLRRAEKR